MAKVPLPERGQPLDVTYIYQLAETVNDLATQVSSATYNYTTINNGISGAQSVKTSETNGRHRAIRRTKVTLEHTH